MTVQIFGTNQVIDMYKAHTIYSNKGGMIHIYKTYIHITGGKLNDYEFGNNWWVVKATFDWPEAKRNLKNVQTGIFESAFTSSQSDPSVPFL